MTPARIALLAVLTAIGACKVSVDPENGEFACNRDSDCVEGWTCFHQPGSDPGAVGVCRQRCGSNSDCADVADAVCGPEGLCTQGCQSNDQCGPGQTCQGGACSTSPCATAPCGDLGCRVDTGGSYSCVSCGQTGAICANGKTCVSTTNTVDPYACADSCQTNAECPQAGTICALTATPSGGPRSVCSTCNNGNCSTGGCAPRLGDTYPWEDASYCNRGGEQCGDGLDNESPNDGAVDCADVDCQTAPFCTGNSEICNDTIDNDVDGNTDCADSDCMGAGNCYESDCGDDFDDDNDGDRDCADRDCESDSGC